MKPVAGGRLLVCAALVCGVTAVAHAAVAESLRIEPAGCDQAPPCALEENCDCAVPGITVRWRAAYCMAFEQTDDLEQAGVQRCLNRSEPAAVWPLNPCAKNEYWKRQVCQATSRRDDVEACVRDKTFIPDIVVRGGGR